MSDPTETGRFAPSTTGPAHPGTLLAALLCWLDARSCGARLVLRLEDLDPQRSKQLWVREMRADLAWLGLDWDVIRLQSDAGERHAAALDELAARGLLYPCSCSRSDIRKLGRASPDGSPAYPNTCRARALPPGGWRASDEPLRLQLADGEIVLRDESGLDLGMDPSREQGDPIVRRRDGGIAYQLASVVDDAAEGVTRIVRGRDLATSSATQVAIARRLELPEPVYRHHLLLLERRGQKLAKLHGAVAAAQLRAGYSAEALCGWLALAAGLRDREEPATPRDLLADFDWQRVADADRPVVWDGERLAFDG